jgi:uncharacterized membrane protein YgcG
MSLPSDNQSAEEARIAGRQLYRAGEPKPAPKPAAPTPMAFTPAKPLSPPPVAKRPAAAKSGEMTKGKRIALMILMLGFGYYLVYGTQEQRKRTFRGLAVVAWLLLLGGISYAVFLPNPKKILHELQSIQQDPNLTREEKREKSRELITNLAPSQRREVFQVGMKERERKANADMQVFLSKSKDEQVAEMKQRVDRMKEWDQRRQQRGNNNARGGGGGGGGNVAGGGGGGGPGGGGGGGGGWGGPGGGGFGGPGFGGGFGGPGGGWGGGGGPGGGGGRGGNDNVAQRARLDNSSPETRAGRSYQFGLMQQLGGGRR